MTEEQEMLIKRFEELAAKLGSEKKAGAQIGVSSSIISQLRSKTYNGDVQKQFNKLRTYFETKASNLSTAFVDLVQGFIVIITLLSALSAVNFRRAFVFPIPASPVTKANPPLILTFSSVL